MVIAWPPNRSTCDRVASSRSSPWQATQYERHACQTTEQWLDQPHVAPVMINNLMLGLLAPHGLMYPHSSIDGAQNQTIGHMANQAGPILCLRPGKNRDKQCAYAARTVPNPATIHNNRKREMREMDIIAVIMIVISKSAGLVTSWPTPLLRSCVKAPDFVHLCASPLSANCKTRGKDGIKNAAGFLRPVMTTSSTTQHYNVLEIGNDLLRFKQRKKSSKSTSSLHTLVKTKCH